MGDTISLSKWGTDSYPLKFCQCGNPQVNMELLADISVGRQHLDAVLDAHIYIYILFYSLTKFALQVLIFSDF